MYYVIEAFINISNFDYPVESVEKHPFDNYEDAIKEFVGHIVDPCEIHLEKKPNGDAMGYICDAHDVYRRIWVICKQDTEEDMNYFIGQLFTDYAQAEAMEYRNERNELEHSVME